MLYDAYVVKMKRLARIRNMIIRYRFLILALMLLTIAAVSTFLFSIGKVTITKDCQEEIVYGESIDFKAKAFLKGVTYEYKSGGSWTNVFPTQPGNHKIRAVSKGFLGGTKYSEVQDFTIKPKEVTLTVNGYNYSYGDEIILNGDLASGDTAKIVGFTNKISSVGQMTINQSNSIIKIVNREGIDVTKCYLITFEETTVSINKRPIIIDIKDAEKVYDGKPLTSQSYDITSGSFVNGDKLDIQFSSSITQVTSITNLPTVSVTDKNGNDVTHFYNIKINAGTLKITKADIKITTGSKKFEYDGNSHTVLDYTVDKNFDSKYKDFTIEVVSNLSFKDAGTHENPLTFAIRDAAGIDVTSFFNIQVTQGKVEITKRNVQITTGSVSSMYTGSNIEHKVITSNTGLVANHTCVVLSDTNPNKINVGKHDNKLSIKIVDETGNNVTGNYNVTYNYGTVEITKRPITVESTSKTYIYTGSNIQHKEFVVSSAIKLADSDSAAVATYAQIMNVGNKENVITIKIYNTLNPDQDRTANYEITYVYGTITVDKRPIVISTSSTEHVYDDTDFSYADYKVTGEYGLPNGHKITTKNVPTIRYVGSIENRFTVDIFDQKGENVNNNYQISYDYGTLTVVKRLVVFKTKDLEKEYDSLALKDETHDLKEKPNLVNGHTYNISGPMAEIFEVGETTNTLTVTDILDVNGKNVTSNYDIQYEYGKLRIYPRVVTILSLSISKTYDGESLTYEESVDKDGRLIPGHTHEAYGFISVTDAGTYPNEFTGCYIYNEIGLDISYNYEIIKEYGVLTINKRSIKVNSLSAEKVYDGYELYNREYQIETGSLVKNHNLEVTESSVIVSAISCHNVFTGYKVTDSSGQDYTHNYDISQLRMGTLTIHKRPITFLTASNSYTYDGLEHFDDSYEIISEYGLADTDSIIETIPTYVKEVGSYTNVVEYVIDNYYNYYGDENYIITYEYGTLTVEEREVRIKPVDLSVVYDGNWHQATDIEAVYSNICSHHTCEVTFGGRIKNVGIITSYITDIRVYEDSNDVTHNYKFKFDTGTIEVTHKEITVTSDNLEKVYDGTPLESPAGGYTISETFENFRYVVLVEQQSITNVGTIDYGHVVETIYDSDNYDATDNFIINYVRGTLEIKPREIHIVTGSYEKVYDGTPLSSMDYEPIEEIDLAPNQFIQWSDDYGTITNVGEIDNKLVVEKIVDLNDNDVTSNYIIIYEYGKLKITPQKLLIVTDTAQKVYDDEPLYCETYQLIGGKLINQDKLEVVNSTYVIYYSEKPVENVLEFKVIDGNTNEESPNYQIICEFGTLQILKRPLQVSTPDLNLIYTSKNVENIDYLIIDPENLVAGQTHQAKRNVELINVGTYDNQLVLEIYSDDDLNVAYCYDISYNYGQVTIAKRVIEIVTGSATKPYDGMPLSSKEYTSSSKYPSPNDYGLGENDQLSITAYTEIVHVGTTENILTFFIENKKGENVNDNYEYSVVNGTLEITDSNLMQDEPDAVIVFDSTSKRTYYDSYKQVWQEDEITVTNSKANSGTNVRSYYNPIRVYSYQKLQVEYKDIKKLVIYCTNSLYSSFTISGAEVQKNGNEITIIFDESVTEFTLNSIPFQMNISKMEIYHGETNNIEPPVIEEPDFEDLFNTDGGLSIGGGGLGGIGEDVVVLKFTSEAEGLVYFRLKSFGDYVTNYGFVEAPTFDFSSYGFNPIYLTSKILEENGFESNSISIVVVLNKTPYLLPYYGTDYNSDGTDAILSRIYDGGYSLEYIDFNILNSDTDFINNVNRAYEEAYREYVYNTYCQVPENLKSTLDKHIKLADLDINSPSVINDLVNYVKTLRKYDKSIEYPEGADHVLYFLETAETGICQQYASAATMMFRELGIPARYTIGFVANAIPETEVEVTGSSYHAWVEIYINGLGWVVVDPTGTGGAQDPNPNPNPDPGPTPEPDPDPDPEPEEPIPLTIKPLDRIKQYDGTTLYPYSFADINVAGITQLIEGADELSTVLLQNLLVDGCTYDITIEGEQTEVGFSESNIVSFTLYNSAGEDITSRYVVTYKPGKLEVVNKLVELRFENQIKYYSGKTYSYTKDMVYQIDGLPNEYQFDYDIVGSITEAGELKAEITNVVLLDKYGNDITHNYEFNCIGKIEVRQKLIIIQTQSDNKKYDGDPLTNSSWWIRMGILVPGDTVHVVMDSSITEIGEIDNLIASYKITNELGQDVTNNYRVNCVFGKLTVTN